MIFFVPFKTKIQLQVLLMYLGFKICKKMNIQNINVHIFGQYEKFGSNGGGGGVLIIFQG